MIEAKTGLWLLCDGDFIDSFGEEFWGSFGERRREIKSQHDFYIRVGYMFRKTDYIFSMIASPNSEHFSSLAPSIRRSKS
jgi:hypothetical protein